MSSSSEDPVQDSSSSCRAQSPPLRLPQTKPPSDAFKRLWIGCLSLVISAFGFTLWAAGDDDEIDVSGGSNARAATGPSGDTVVVFEADDADETGIFAGIYDSAGQLLGSLFQVNIETSGDQEEPDVTWLPSGEFVVVWTSDEAVYSTIESRRYDSLGTPTTGELQIDGGGQTAETPRIDADDRGRFTVVWAADGAVLHRRFAADGTALGTEQVVNTGGDAEDPALAVQPTGEQLVAWAEGLDVIARRYDAGGTAQGQEFFVHPLTPGERSEPSLSASGDGAFLAAYRSEGQDGSNGGVFARRIEEVAVGEEFQINTVTTSEQSLPSLGLTDDGQILVTWQSEGGLDGDSAGIFGRYLRPTGRPVCPDTAVNTRTADAQRVSSVAAGARQFRVTWQSESPVPLPGEVPSIRARILVPPLFADGFESGDLSAWTIPGS